MKIVLITLFLSGLSHILFGQDLKTQRLFPFDNERFKEALEEHNRFIPDSMINPDESIRQKLDDRNTMQIYPVPKDQMPNMVFRNDIKYTLRIKKYNLCYPYTPEDTVSNHQNRIFRYLRKDNKE